MEPPWKNIIQWSLHFIRHYRPRNCSNISGRTLIPAISPPNLLLKLYQREIGEGTDIEVFVLRQKIIWPVLIVCLAGLLFGGLIHFLVILLIPIGLLVLITCQGIAESEIPQLKESLTELLKIRS